MLLEPTPTPALSSLAPHGPPSWCGVLGVVNTVFPSLSAAAYQRAVPVGTTRSPSGEISMRAWFMYTQAPSLMHLSSTQAISATDQAQQGTCRAHVSSHRPFGPRNPHLLEAFSELCRGLRCCSPGLLSSASASAQRRQLSLGPLGLPSLVWLLPPAQLLLTLSWTCLQ